MGQNIKQLNKLGDLSITHHVNNLSAIIPTCFHGSFLHKALQFCSLLRTVTSLGRHTHTRTHTHARRHTRTHTLAQTRARAHRGARAHTHTRAHPHTHTHAHAHTRAHTHAHTHTHTHSVLTAEPTVCR